jgi:UDP-N-acetylglucosamine--N-acetylmuramyl-(pentapeptide) pyrophosphoryl-undecaprenol N-acetylglucosamine transferase
VPGLNLAQRLAATGCQVHLLRGGRAVENAFLGEHSLASVHSLRGANGGLSRALGVLRGASAARRLLRRIDARVVVGLGGGDSLPGALAALSLRRPLVLLEQNVVAGRVNRWLSRFAFRAYTAFPETAGALPRAIATGTPLRPRAAAEAAFFERLGLAHLARRPRSRTVLLVVGGSQGAQAMNAALPALLARLPAELRAATSVVHVAGSGKEAATMAAYAGTDLEVHVLAFERDLLRLYELADLVVCRGGGTSLCEIAAAGRPAVVVPYPWHKDRHQEKNGEWFERVGSCRVLPQARLEKGDGADLLAGLLRDGELRRAMGERGRQSLPLDGASRIAADIVELARPLAIETAEPVVAAFEGSAQRRRA